MTPVFFNIAVEYAIGEKGKMTCLLIGYTDVVNITSPSIKPTEGTFSC